MYRFVWLIASAANDDIDALNVSPSFSTAVDLTINHKQKAQKRQGHEKHLESMYIHLFRLTLIPILYAAT